MKSLKTTGVLITPGTGSPGIELNGILLQEVPSTDGNVLLYKEPSSAGVFYFLRSDVYRSAVAKDIMPISVDEVLKRYPDAVL